ncbi:hypothetical protein [Paracoccus aminophilus]|uniref:Uncharacterized protein n=1 Tax=Paracoccus aminophilus JCM 7686 TaxID=1367847 RepID=S5XP51_PARAH|nr:hypothetical protein [Paracoccus aminophilus]AGT09089.1 hypothetical protein JCM7686_1988 [Paracoccus aminophilus JCM 7686]
MRLSKYLSLEDEKERSLVARRFVASAAIGILISALLSFCSGWNIFGGSGLVDRIGSLTANLTGFYVAALVAVTTFGQGRPEMESEMPSGKVYLLDRGERVSINRREYVTALFGHLVILAFFVTIVSIAGTLGAAAVGPVFDEVELIGGISSQRLIVFYFLHRIFSWWPT